MGDDTKIQWTDATWNPTRGCTVVSPGCTNCYAMKQARRMDHPGGAYEGLTQAKLAQRIFRDGSSRSIATDVTWNGKVREIPSVLDQPLRWKKPRRIFVNSMSDLFHEGVSDDFIDRVFAVMALAGMSPMRRAGNVRQERRHTFQILTKRPERMRDYLTDGGVASRVWLAARKLDPHGDGLTVYRGHLRPSGEWGSTQELVPPEWPLPWVHLGVSVEDQKRADERIPDLLATPAAVRFISAEPLLSDLRLTKWLCGHCPYCGSDGWEGHFPESRQVRSGNSRKPTCPDCRRTQPNFPTEVRRASDGEDYHYNALHWVIVGGESGHKARPCQVEWVRDIVEQCQSAEVPVFVKQLGANYVDAANGIGGAQAKDPADPMATVERLEHSKGGDMDEWPADLRVREFPSGRHT